MGLVAVPSREYSLPRDQGPTFSIKRKEPSAFLTRYNESLHQAREIQHGYIFQIVGNIGSTFRLILSIDEDGN